MKEISSENVVYTDSKGNDVTLPADTVVLAMGSRPEKSLATKLEGKGIDIRAIGDANKGGRVGGAIEAGFNLACTI
jgi:2,4-dienoyl-CoA reductase (NADPH2)